ncbi:MAG: hypothetical protein ACRDIX_04165 [Actinomycetota bacterium]
MLEGRGRILVRWGLALVGLVGLVVLLSQLSARLSRQADTFPPDRQRGHVVQDIDTIAGLREAFNEDPGHVRVVLLLSPT